jgi:hypothetical protein
MGQAVNVVIGNVQICHNLWPNDLICAICGKQAFGNLIFAEGRVAIVIYP